MEGSDGAIAMSPIVDTSSLSNTGSHVVPLFVVFHTPPDAAPTNTMLGLLSTTAKSSMRPPIIAGPISRNSRLFHLSVDLASSPGLATLPAVHSAHPSTPAIIIRTTHVNFRICIPPRTRLGMIPPPASVPHQLFTVFMNYPVTR